MLIKCNAYFNILDLNLSESFPIIEDILQQYFNERLHNQFILQDTITRAIGGEGLDYNDYVIGNKNNDNISIYSNKKKIAKLKEKQNKLLKKLL